MPSDQTTPEPWGARMGRLEAETGGEHARNCLSRPEQTTIRAGDHVEHGPTGETWVVGRVSAEHVEPFGWPRSRALRADCRLVRAATDAEHAKALADAERVWG